MQALLRKLIASDIDVRVDSGTLKLKVPKGIDAKAILQEVKDNKAELIAYITGLDKGDPTTTRIRESPHKTHYRLSSAQKRMYFLHEFDKSSLAYNMPQAVRLEGRLDKDRLTEAFERLIARHESLRTSFHVVGQEPVQQVANQVPFKIECFPGDNRPPDEILHSFIRPFDLTHAPLLRIGLVPLSPDSHLLLVDIHHIITDGISQGLLIRDLTALYNCQQLPPLRVQYKDYAEWQQNPAEQVKLASQKERWLERFADLPEPLDLPMDFPRPAQRNEAGDSLHFTIDAATSTCLKDLAASENVTPFMVVLAIYATLLARLSNHNDIVIGVPAAGRRHHDLDGVIGMFVNTLPIRIRPAGDNTFPRFLKELGSQTWACFEQQDYQYEELIDSLKIRRDSSRNPLFDVLFAYEDYSDFSLELPGLTLTAAGSGNKTAKFDLSLTAMEIDGQFHFDLDFATALFKKETIARFADYFSRITAALSADPDCRLADIPMLPPAERQLLLETFNNTTTPFPSEATLTSLFETQAARTPDNTALRFREQMLSYRQLNEKANRLAHFLQSKGACTGSTVALLLDRSIDMIVAIIAILKAGAAYLPLDIAYPDLRIRQLLDNSNTRFLLTSHGNCRHPESIDIDDPAINLLDDANLLPAASAEDLAYIIHTSGSTGIPKGVMTSHRSVINFISSRTKAFRIDEKDRVLQFSTICFDASVEQIWLALLNGAALVLIDKTLLTDNSRFNTYLAEHQVTHLDTTPSFLESIELDHQPSLLRIVSGGEACKPHLAAKFGRDYRLYNEYGPTETTIASLEYRVSPEEAGQPSIPIGRPIQNTRVYILGKYGELLPTGAKGELFIGGEGLAKGYLHNEPLTREKFLPDPFRPGELVYRTGDLAGWRPDGNIDFFGRVDDQVKIRGFRIEPGEIESRLQSHPHIQQAIVLPQGEDEERRLIAYYVAQEELPAPQLRAFLAQTLPDHFLPAAWIRLDTLPLTPNGKLDKKALPAPRLETADIFCPPQGPTEEKLAAIWADILKIPRARIPADKSFFELGGHSLRAITLVNNIHKQLKTEVPVREIFGRQTIRELARFIRETAKTEYLDIGKAPVKDRYPLSSAQKRMYFLHEFDKSSLAYNMPQAVRLEGRLDKDRLTEAFERLIARHESLRTSFHVVDQEPVQQVAHQVPFTIECFPDDNHRPDEILRSFIRPFDLTRPPLLRIGLAPLGPDNHLLLVDMHHIITDGISQGLLIGDFTDLYNRRELPSLRLQYKDYAEWQQNPAEQVKLASQMEFWLASFADLPDPLDLPTDHRRPTLHSEAGDFLRFTIDTSTSTCLKDLAASENVTPFMVVLAVYATLLARLSNHNDIVIGTPVGGRRHADLETMIGMFVNMLALRFNPEGHLSFRRFLREVRSRTLACFDNQDYPYEELIEDLQLRRDVSRNPLFDAAFNYDNFEPAGFSIPGISLSPYNCRFSASKFDLSLTAWEIEGQFHFDLTYSTALFKKETIARFADYFSRITAALSADPDCRLADIPMLPPAERQLLLETLNNTTTPFPSEATLTSLFETQAARTPDNTALRFREQMLSYRQLNEKANRLARFLQSKGACTGSAVALLLDRSIDMIVAIIAILKAGAAYLPLDIAYPDLRIRQLLDNSNTRFLLTSHGNCRHPESIDIDDPAINLLDDANLLPAASAEDLAYIIHTSGSTGIPKGVMTSHRSVINYIYAQTELFGINETDRILQFSTICFDASVEQIWLALLNGAALVLIDKTLLTDNSRFNTYLAEHQVTHLHATPSFLESIELDHQPTLRRIVSGGERCQWQLVHKFDGYRFYNKYGPTETTVTSIETRIDPAQYDHHQPVPIGRPIQNTRVYILGKYGELLPTGAKGELFIGGEGLAKGYLHNEPLTREKFLPDPFRPGELVYRTGDLAGWRPDGNIDFFGRIDDQVKIRGFRIEPGEIESRLQSHPLIQQAIVLPHGDDEERRLIAYYVAQEELPAPQLRAFLAQTLPDHFLPAAWLRLDTLPLTPNGKLDKKALPAPRLETAGSFCPPQGITEEKLAAIWADILKIPGTRIPADKSFFELGGHSLKATRLAFRIQKEFQKEIPLRDIFLSPTIRDIARKLIRKTGPAWNEQLSLLKHTPGSSDYLFFIHDGSGDIQTYVALSGLVGAFTCWGIRSSSFGYPSPILTDVEGLAEQYIGWIRTVQPEGPYRLAAWSLGGTIAFEMARQLEKAGSPVQTLVMIDSVFPMSGYLNEGSGTAEFSVASEKKLLADLLDTTPDTLQRAVTMEQLYRELEALLQADHQACTTLRNRLPARFRPLIPHFNDMEIPELLLQLHTIRMLEHAVHNYLPSGKLGTRLVYLRASQSGIAVDHLADHFGPPVRILEIAGDHFSIFQPPQLARLGRVLARELETTSLLYQQ